jgi:FkbM family methyltransferase
VYSLTAARCVGATGRVWAFEPSSATAACLARGIERNRFDTLHLIQAGLSNKNGQAKLMISPNTELGFVAEEGAAEGAHEIVFLKTLDDCMNEWGWKDIDFMKMDAEGHEEKIIVGGTRFFNSNSPLILYEIKAGDKINLGIADAFAALGYRSYRLIPGLNTLVPFNKSEQLDGYQLNLFCCKPDRAGVLSRQGMLVDDPLPEKPGEPSSTDWLNYLEGFPFAKGLKDAWREYARSQGTQPEWQVYESVLNSYARAHNPVLSMPERYNHLQRAYARLAELLAKHATLPRLMSFARIASDLGKRADAVQALHYLIGTPFPPLSSWLNEPFLALADDLEPPDPERNFPEWLRAAILARYEKLYAFSSFFSGRASLENSLQQLEAIKHSPLRSPEMERRRQLIRQRIGLQRSQQPDALLTRKTVDNLNPDFWAVAKPI